MSVTNLIHVHLTGVESQLIGPDTVFIQRDNCAIGARANVPSQEPPLVVTATALFDESKRKLGGMDRAWQTIQQLLGTIV
jgi:hypothetical protein